MWYIIEFAVPEVDIKEKAMYPLKVESPPQRLIIPILIVGL